VSQRPTDDQIQTMLHALGNSHTGTTLGWRNRYCDSVSPSDPDIDALRDLGYMHNLYLLNQGRDVMLEVTDAGIAFLRAEGHTILLETP
jgi:hypothetical protein